MSDIEGVDTGKEEKLKEIWGEDKLGRKADADYLIRFLASRIVERGERGEKKSYVLNIDSQWGGGKTFFLKRFGDHLEKEGYLVARVNAWADDHCEDPLIAVMDAVDSGLKEFLKDDPAVEEFRSQALKSAGRLAWAFTKGVAVHAGVKLLGEAGTDIIQAIVEGDEDDSKSINDKIEAGLSAAKQESERDRDKVALSIFEDFRSQKSLITTFSGALEALLNTDGPVSVSSKFRRGRTPPLFVLVDEMDRCRPPYAIALLERVKHLFNIDNVVFVFATDTKQLSHSIKAVYGEGFESLRYLHRFFDQTYMFPEPPAEKFIAQLLQKKPISDKIFQISHDPNLAKFCAGCFEDIGSSLRDIEQCMDILHNVISGWPKNGPPIQGVLMLPLVVAYHRNKLIHLPWGEELLDEIRPDLAGRRNNEIAWKVSMSTGDYDGPSRRTENVNCWGMLELYIRWSLFDFTRLAQQGGSQQKLPSWKRDVQSSIESEYRSMGSGIQPAELMLRQYPQMIASAGRLRGE
ncbi:MAG: hypothetical protein ACJAXQ_000014 [Parvibaculaceae bacterium]|jgi:hypothetical protein